MPETETASSLKPVLSGEKKAERRLGAPRVHLLKQSLEAAKIKEPGLAGPVFDAVVVGDNEGAAVTGNRNAFRLVGDPAVGRLEIGYHVVHRLLAVADQIVGSRIVAGP